MPCAIQDRRTRHVSNWLTVPLLIVARPVALLIERFALPCAVFVGVYVATPLEPRAGAADGKLMVGSAAFAPLALGIGARLEMLVFSALGLRGRRDASISGALRLYLGSVLSTGVWAILAIFGTKACPWRRRSGDSCTCVPELLAS